MSKRSPRRLAGHLLTAKVRAAICEHLAEGESLRSICTRPGMPNRRTVGRELAADEDFARQFATARETGLEALSDEILAIADDSSGDWFDRVNEDGTVSRIPNLANIQRARLQIDARKWTLSKLLPKKFGDKVLVGADPDNPLPTGRTAEDVTRDYAALARKIQERRDALCAQA